jgi:hypothetical protein
MNQAPTAPHTLRNFFKPTQRIQSTAGALPGRNNIRVFLHPTWLRLRECFCRSSDSVGVVCYLLFVFVRLFLFLFVQFTYRSSGWQKWSGGRANNGEISHHNYGACQDCADRIHHNLLTD